jgi:[protein-PII] uridylyltransferase
MDDDMNRETMVIESRDIARAELISRGLSEASIDSVWSFMSDDYFLKYRDEEIVWHTEWLANEKTDGDVELVNLRRQANGEGVEVAFYTDQRKHTFAHATALLDELGTTIVDARIVPFDNGFSLDTFVFLELDSRTEIDEARLKRLLKAMRSVIDAKDDQIKTVTRERSRRARMFKTRTAVDFDKYSLPDKTAMELIAADRPGLLSKVGKVLMEQGIDIETAKIMTIGERAEDVFYISKEDGAPLTSEQKDQLSAALLRAIDS